MVNIYIDKKSIIHKTPFLIKLIIVSLVVVSIQVNNTNLYVMLASLVFCILVYLLAKISLRYLWNIVKLFFPMMLGIGLYHIYQQQWLLACQAAIQIISGVGLANLLSLTTPLHKILEEDTKSARILTFLHIPVSVVRLILAIIFRTVPVLVHEVNELKVACQLRGNKRLYITIVFILLLRIIKQTDDLVDSLFLRGYK